MTNENPGMKRTHVIGGGTVYHIRPHLALSAVAYGNTARKLADLCRKESDKLEVVLHLTKMADYQSKIETNSDVNNLVDKLIEDYSTKIVFFNPALVDYEGSVLDNGVSTESGKYLERINTAENPIVNLELRSTSKILGRIRKRRKDIFLIGFKTTCGFKEDEQYISGLNLLKKSSSNLVLANDVKTRTNMIITPEEARYHVTNDRDEVLKNLVEMAYLRSHLTFTRSTIVSGTPVPWSSNEVPDSLSKVVDYCIREGAYKEFRGSTVGHFAVKLDDRTFLTSRRKTNFNELDKIGLVKIVTDGPDSVLAYGSKPSVGGQSQRIVFSEHPEYNCIVHFHCPIKECSLVNQVSQREYECGSHECGKNTSKGLRKFGNLSAVYLKEHGPNIVFNSSINPEEVIKFIDENFDLSKKTGGYVNLNHA